jgi:hypothetical protein
VRNIINCPNNRTPGIRDRLAAGSASVPRQKFGWLILLAYTVACSDLGE